MCGRFSIAAPVEAIEEHFHINVSDNEYQPRYNAAPGQNLPVILMENSENLSFCKWGLVPHWAKDDKIGYKMINARGETVAEKASFKTPFKTKRCLVIADGFFEWQRLGKEKTPFHFKLKDQDVFAFAGLYDEWKNEDGNILRTFTIITTEPNELLKTVHDRMPVILRSDNEADWLNPKLPLKVVQDLIKPYNANQMTKTKVSNKVNNVKNDSPDILKVSQTTLA